MKTPVRKGKPIERVTSLTQRHRGKEREIILQIGPGDVIGFRLYGCRHVVRLEIGDAYWTAMRAHAGMGGVATRKPRIAGRPRKQSKRALRKHPELFDQGRAA